MPQSSNVAMGRFAPATLSQLEPHIHKEIKNILGFSEPTLLQAALNSIQGGGHEKDIESRLASMLEGRKARKLSRKIYEAVDEFCVTHELPRLESSESSRKRKASDESESPATKKTINGSAGSESGATVGMSVEQIRAIMSNTKKQIEERKKQLQGTLSGPNAPLGADVVGPQKPATRSAAGADDKFKSIAALQAQIQSRMDKMKLPVATGPTSLILDSQGRTVDATGQQIQLAQHVPTLKANLRAKKRDEMKEHFKEGPAITQEALESKFFDPRVVGKGAVRTKRTFKFNDPGKFQNEGNRLRMKAQLDKLQADIASVARRTGISSATQLAKLVPKETEKGRIPEVEWWDAHLMHPESNYEEPVFRDGAITNLIEHPIQLKPLESSKPEQIPVYLTKKERKKMRRQNRREAWKEKQDKIRIGLIPPDEPKVKMSNLMRVLGNEAVQDPTKIEAHVRSQMAKRLDTHEQANSERKLTPEERKDKMRRKLEEDTSFGVQVAIYWIKSLMNPAKKFKVLTNANQYNMTGCIVYYEDVNVVVVEGGPKQQKKYKQLMLNRIKWDEETYKKADGSEGDNSCVLVWEGQTKERNFKDMFSKQCPSESFARDFFRNHQVEHYWDLAYSFSVQEET